MDNKATNNLDLDAKLAGLDDHLEPLETKEEVKEEVDAEPEETSAEEEQSSDEAKAEEEVVSEDNAEDGETTEDSESDEGYTIDGDEDTVEEPVDPIKGDTSNLNPEQQYIIDNLKPITVRGQVGDKVETFTVLDPSQLPQGFRFLDDRDQALAVKAFAMLENQAERLQNDYRTQETTKAAQQFKQREDTADRQDIGNLQRSGDLPKFKADPSSKEFGDDPGVKLVQEIIDFKETTNARYMDEYNAGRPYKHIGFEEAFRMYKRENPQETAQAKEDADRSNIAKRTTKSKGSTEPAKERARVHSGSSSRDLDNLIESLDW